MKKYLLIALSAAVTPLAACGGTATYADLENVPAATPTKIEAYTNIDKHPNLVRLCIDGKAFITTSRKGAGAWRRADYFDAWCSTDAGVLK